MNTRNDLYESICQARAERARVEKIEGIIGGAIFSALGACVLYAIALWVIR